MFKLPYNDNKTVLKIFQAKLQQYLNWELLDVQVGFRKGRGTKVQIANIHWIKKKQGNFKKKKSTFASLTTLKPLTMWVTTNWEILKEMRIVPVSWEICMQVKKQQLEPHMEQRTGSKSGEEYVKTIYYHPAYLTYIQY